MYLLFFCTHKVCVAFLARSGERLRPSRRWGEGRAPLLECVWYCSCARFNWTHFWKLFNFSINTELRSEMESAIERTCARNCRGPAGARAENNWTRAQPHGARFHYPVALGTYLGLLNSQRLLTVDQAIIRSQRISGCDQLHVLSCTAAYWDPIRSERTDCTLTVALNRRRLISLELRKTQQLSGC